MKFHLFLSQIFKSDPSSTEYTETKPIRTNQSNNKSVKPASTKQLPPPLPTAPPQLNRGMAPPPPTQQQQLPQQPQPQQQSHRRTPSLEEIPQNSNQSSPLSGSGVKGASSTSVNSDNGSTYTNFTYAQARARLRPTSGIYNQYTAGKLKSSNRSFLHVKISSLL